MTHAARAHSDVSPSGAERWWNCPGSVALLTALRKAGKIQERVNIAAERGTAGHELLEKCLKTGKHPVTFKREKFNGIIPDQEILDAVEFAFEYVNTMRADRFYEARVESEQYVHISAINFDTISDDGGTIDVAIVPVETSGPNATKILIVLDYKQGRQPVSAERNKQLLLYACGLQEKSFWYYEKIVLGIIQPRSMDGIQHSIWECTAKELAEFEADAKVHYRATQALDAPRIPGEKQCQWCEAKPHCPEFLQSALATAKVDFDMLANPQQVKPPFKQRAFTLENAREIRDAYNNLWMLEDVIKIIKENVYTLLKRGDTTLGLKLVAGKSNRQWKDETKVMESLAKAGLKPDDFAPRHLAGLGVIEKLLTKLKGPAIRDHVMKQWTIKPPGQPTIVPAEDPRPAISGPEADFKGYYDE